MRLVLIIAAAATCAACQPDPNDKQIALPAEQTQPACQDFSTPITSGGRPGQASGQACRHPDGSWRVVQNTPGLPAQDYVVPAPGQPPAAASTAVQPAPNQPPCSNYTVPVTVGGQQQEAVVEACPQPDGSWRNHPDHAGTAAAGLCNPAAGRLSLPLQQRISRRLRLSGCLSVLGGLALVIWPGAVDRRRTEVQSLQPWLRPWFWAWLRPWFRAWFRARLCGRPRRRASLDRRYFRTLPVRRKNASQVVKDYRGLDNHLTVMDQCRQDGIGIEPHIGGVELIAAQPHQMLLV